MGMFGENSPFGQNGIVGGLMGGMGMNMSQIPFVGGLFPNPAEQQMQQALAGAAQAYAGAMPQFNQAYQNLLGNVLGIYSPAQNALQQIYGGGGMPQMSPGGSAFGQGAQAGFGGGKSANLNTGLSNIHPAGQGGGIPQQAGPGGFGGLLGGAGGLLGGLGGLGGGLLGGAGNLAGGALGGLGGLGGGALGGLGNLAGGASKGAGGLLGGLPGLGGGGFPGLGGGGGGGLPIGLPGLGGGGGLPFLGGGGGGGGGGLLGLGFLGL